MAQTVSLSKTKLLDYRQCPRKLWLNQYSPKLEDESAEAEARFQTGHVVGEAARQVYGHDGGHRISNTRGLRAAIGATAQLIEAGGSKPIFEATFDHQGLIVQIDILDRSADEARLIEVKSSASLKEHYADDCAIQAWVLAQLDHPVKQVTLAHLNNEFSYPGDGDYRGLFTENDLTDEVVARFAAMPTLIAQARATLDSLSEPDIVIGEQCRKPYPCPFFAHCAPTAGKYPISGLGGSKKRIDELIHAGYRDLRDVPLDLLSSDAQRLIVQRSKLEQPFIGTGLKAFAEQLAYPRHYLDFETIAFAVPIWRDTRPYEALPFQWSCHVDHDGERLEHHEFLDLSANAPMRQCAQTLIETLGDSGPILMYTTYEKRMIDAMIRRYSDLAAPLAAIVDRLVDLHPVVQQQYYHPDMLGSWSIKAVLPTLATDLSYAALGEVQDGNAAQTAYLEAIKPETSEPRRAQIKKDLLDYCRYDTLALVRIVAFFAASQAASG